MKLALLQKSAEFCSGFGNNFHIENISNHSDNPFHYRLCNILNPRNIIISGFNQDDRRFWLADLGLLPLPSRKKSAKFVLFSGSRSHRTINKFNKKENLNLFESIKTFQLRFGSFEWVDLGNNREEKKNAATFITFFRWMKLIHLTLRRAACHWGGNEHKKVFLNTLWTYVYRSLLSFSFLSININSPRILLPIAAFPISDSILRLSLVSWLWSSKVFPTWRFLFFFSSEFLP